MDKVEMNGIPCGIFRSTLGEAVETKKFLLLLYCSNDKSVIGMKLYKGSGIKTLCAVCERDKKSAMTRYAYKTDKNYARAGGKKCDRYPDKGDLHTGALPHAFYRLRRGVLMRYPDGADRGKAGGRIIFPAWLGNNKLFLFDDDGKLHSDAVEPDTGAYDHQFNRLYENQKNRHIRICKSMLTEESYGYMGNKRLMQELRRKQYSFRCRPAGR